MDNATLAYHTIVVDLNSGIKYRSVADACTIPDENMRIKGTVVAYDAVIANINIWSDINVIAYFSRRLNHGSRVYTLLAGPCGIDHLEKRCKRFVGIIDLYHGRLNLIRGCETLIYQDYRRPC